MTPEYLIRSAFQRADPAHTGEPVRLDFTGGVMDYLNFRDGEEPERSEADKQAKHDPQQLGFDGEFPQRRQTCLPRTPHILGPHPDGRPLMSV